MIKARIHPITGAIESYETKPKRVVNKFDTNFFIVGFNNCSDETELEQGFETVNVPELIDGKMYSEVKGDTGNFYIELIDLPVRPKFFDDRQAYNRMLYYFTPRIGVVAPYTGILLKMLENKAFLYMKNYLNNLISQNCIEQQDFDNVNFALKLQGIDLNDSTTWENVI